MTFAVDVTEAQFTRAVTELAFRQGFECSHFHDSRRQVVKKSGGVAWIGDAAAAGFPDLTLARPPRVLFVELKARKGVLRPAQQRWLTVLRDCPGVEVYVWRPADWPEIIRVLAR